jgi:cysteine desulfurase
VAEEAVAIARAQVAALIGCESSEIYFTSGATEAINLALKGIAASYRGKGNHIITLATEHKAVLDTCRYLENMGMAITYLTVNRGGLFSLDELQSSMKENTIMVAAMLANNETGVVFPAKEIADMCAEKNCLFFSDATQAAGKIQMDVKASGIDCCALSAHKLYGPKGVGALYVSRKKPRVSLTAQMHGGGHENGLRSGTLNVPGIVGFGEACAIAANDMWDDNSRLSRLRTMLEQALCETEKVFVNGDMRNRLPNTTNLLFSGIAGADLIKQLNGIAVSTGSACTSALAEPSHVLKAMGLSDEESFASIRFSAGRFTTEEEITFAIEKIKNIIA